MTIHEEVTSYQVAVLHNDIMDIRRMLRLTTVSGTQLFLAFVDTVPSDWLQFPSPGHITVYLSAADFDASYRVLRSESPIYVSSLNLIGIRGFNLGSGDEAPGQGLADPQPLVEFMQRARAEAS